MGRRIVVLSNCQLGATAAALAAMLPDDAMEPVMYPGFVPDDMAERLAGADVWVSCARRHESEAVLAGMGEAGTSIRLVAIPMLWFFGFHPDILHARAPDGSELPSGASVYSSSIVTWGWKHGLGADEIVARFTPAVMDGLGYTTGWDERLGMLRTIVELTDVDFPRWYLPLVGSGSFMLTDNHPRVAAIVGVARQAAEMLGADPVRLAVPWEELIPDGLLATAAVWPVYPSVAASLGIVGSYVWRTPEGELIELDEFVRRTLEVLAPFDPEQVVVPELVDDRRFDQVLGTGREVSPPAVPVAPEIAVPDGDGVSRRRGGPGARWLRRRG